MADLGPATDGFAQLQVFGCRFNTVQSRHAFRVSLIAELDR